MFPWKGRCAGGQGAHTRRGCCLHSAARPAQARLQRLREHPAPPAVQQQRQSAARERRRTGSHHVCRPGAGAGRAGRRAARRAQRAGAARLGKAGQRACTLAHRPASRGRARPAKGLIPPHERAGSYLGARRADGTRLARASAEHAPGGTARRLRGSAGGSSGSWARPVSLSAAFMRLIRWPGAAAQARGRDWPAARRVLHCAGARVRHAGRRAACPGTQVMQPPRWRPVASKPHCTRTLLAGRVGVQFEHAVRRR